MSNYGSKYETGNVETAMKVNWSLFGNKIKISENQNGRIKITVTSKFKLVHDCN